MKALSRATVAETVALLFLTGGLSFAAYQYGGGNREDWNVALLLFGIAALATRSSWADTRSRLEKLAVIAALAFPFYVALQLLPLPLPILQLLNPQRAEIAQAVAGLTDTAGATASTTVAPERTIFHLSRVVGYVLVFLTVRSLAVRAQWSRWVLVLPLLLVALAESVVGLMQSASGAPVAGTFGSRNFFGGFLALALPFALMWGIRLMQLESSRSPRRAASGFVLPAVLLLGAGFAMFAAITLGLSRMAFLSTLASLGVITVLALTPGKPWRYTIATSSALVIGVLILSLFAPSDDLMARLGETDETLGGRLLILQDTLRMAADYPLFGVGFGAYYPGLLRYQTELLNYTIPNAHNDYAEMLSEVGLLGATIPAVFVLALLALTIRTGIDSEPLRERALPIACAGAFCAMLIHSAVDFNFHVPANAAAFFWIAGLASTTGTRSAPPSRSVTHRSGGRSLRLVPHALAALAIVHAVSSRVYAAGDMTPEREAKYCAFGVCDSSGAKAALQASHGDVASIPPKYLEELLERDPANPFAWCDLCDSYLKSGRVDEARTCVNRALALGPELPFLKIRAARIHFGTGDEERALALSARAIATNASWAYVVLTEYESRGISVDRILARGIPHTPAAGAAYMRFLMNRKAEDAATVWQWIVRNDLYDEVAVRRYIERLSRDGNDAAAFQVWRDYATRQMRAYTGGDAVFNGSFETEPIPVRFDWRISPVKEVEVSFDSEVKYSGGRSLRIDFDDAANPTDLGIRQAIYLGGGKHVFRAYVRTKDISTDGGLVFTVRSAAAPNSLSVTTRDLEGSNDWTLVEQEFDVPPGGGLAWVGIARKRTFSFDRYVSGSAWIDQVSVTPVPPA